MAQNSRGKTVTVGIPRALSYYQYFPMWQAFFESLGAEVVISPATSRVTVEEGRRRVVADTCLPVKVFIGHVVWLVGRCDYVFIPAIRSLRAHTYNCSKFLGLPDLVRAVIPEVPPILSIDVDINKGRPRLYRAIYRLGSHFTRNPESIRRAAVAGWQTHLRYRELLWRERLAPFQAMSSLASPLTQAVSSEAPRAKTTIAVIGHPYLLYDDYISHKIIGYLRRNQHAVLTPDMVSEKVLESVVVRVMGSAQWLCEDEVVGAGDYYLKSGVDGVINLMPFGCGPDSLMADVVRRQAAYGDTPFMNLLIDEHTSEVGIVTRLEAFLDMLGRKKRQSCV